VAWQTLVFLVAAVVCGFASGWYAREKGRNVALWALGGTAGGLIGVLPGLLVVVVAGRMRPVAH
jgi:hypothetical protein